MSQENVDVLHRAIEAWNAGDMDRVVAEYAPDAIMRGLERWPEPGPYFGRDDIRQAFERIHEPWESDSIEVVEDARAVGDRVVSRWRWRVEGQGPQTETEFSTLITVRGGKIHYFEYFWDHEEALQAVGLSE
jgi:ketosteroid isomerase-like protein